MRLESRAPRREQKHEMEVKPSYHIVSNPYPENVNAQEWSVLFAGSSQTRPGHAVGPRVYDYCLVHFVESGYGQFACRDGAFGLGPGDSFVIEPESLVSYRADADEPWAYQWVAFQGAKAVSILHSIGLSSRHSVVRAADRPRVSALFRQIREALRRGGPNVNLEARGYLNLLAFEYGKALEPAQDRYPQAVSRTERQVRQAIHYLHTQYSEPLTIERMARSMGYNRAYFSKVFKQSTGQTPVRFLLNVRLNKSKLLLRQNAELTVEQVAFSVGFRDPLHFSKQFKRRFGLSPLAYRKEVLPGK